MTEAHREKQKMNKGKIVKKSWFFSHCHRLTVGRTRSNTESSHRGFSWYLQIATAVKTNQNFRKIKIKCQNWNVAATKKRFKILLCKRSYWHLGNDVTRKSFIELRTIHLLINHHHHPPLTPIGSIDTVTIHDAYWSLSIEKLLEHCFDFCIKETGVQRSSLFFTYSHSI